MSAAMWGDTRADNWGKKRTDFVCIKAMAAYIQLSWVTSCVREDGLRVDRWEGIIRIQHINVYKHPLCPTFFNSPLTRKTSDPPF